jgi:Tfp pilus assembly protein FimT
MQLQVKSPGKTVRAFAKGFTLVELLVLGVIMGIVLSIGIANYQRQKEANTLSAALIETKSFLQLARKKALANELPGGCSSVNFLGHGVSFNKTNDTVGLTYYCSSKTTIQSLSLSTQYKNTDITSNTVDLYFRRLSGDLNTSAQSICIQHKLSKLYGRIDITSLGKISVYDKLTACP